MPEIDGSPPGSAWDLSINESNATLTMREVAPPPSAEFGQLLSDTNALKIGAAVGLGALAVGVFSWLRSRRN